MTRLCFSIFFSFLFFITHAQTKAVIEQYIATYAPLAIAEQIRTGIPASIKLAQAIHESGAGQGDLAIRSNNHFGIKCKSNWTGPTAFHDDDEKGECFRAYMAVEESYRDHSDFLKNSARYNRLFQINPKDYEAWANGLKQAGYATNPKYPVLLIKLIEEYGLQQYTLVALSTHKELPLETENVIGKQDS